MPTRKHSADLRVINMHFLNELVRLGCISDIRDRIKIAVLNNLKHNIAKLVERNKNSNSIMFYRIIIFRNSDSTLNIDIRKYV